MISNSTPSEPPPLRRWWWLGLQRQEDLCTKELESLVRTRREKSFGLPKKSKDSALKVPESRSFPESWMSLLDDCYLMSSLTIPGTHDSAAYTLSLPFVATQEMTILQQLNAGIRYFDLRCGLRKDRAEMVHGPTLLGLGLAEVLKTMYQWLDSHTREALIVQIKEDRKAEQSNVHFSQVIASFIESRPDRWRIINDTPTLGQLRGQILLFRRYDAPIRIAYGIDVTKWVDNSPTPFTLHTLHGVLLTIQDHYSFPDATPLPELVARKGGDVADLLNQASRDTDFTHWYLNFTSANEFNLSFQITPRTVAVGGYWWFRWEDGINPRLVTYISERQSRHRFGIVIMDFPELGAEDLVVSLARSNFETQKNRWSTKLLYMIAIMVFMMFVVTLIRSDGAPNLGPPLRQVLMIIDRLVPPPT